jgi:hypothetical protein
MKKQYKNYKDLLKENRHKEKLTRRGFKFIRKSNKIKKILAYILIALGLITSFLPTGSFLLIGFGCLLLGIEKDELKRLYKVRIYRRKAKRNNKIK